MLKPVLFCALLLVPQAALASVLIDAQELDLPEVLDTAPLAADALTDARLLLEASLGRWPGAMASPLDGATEGPWRVRSSQRGFRALVDVPLNAKELAETGLVQRLGTFHADLPSQVDASSILSAYAQAWAYRDSGLDGPNCWQTAIASTSPGWSRARYMGPAEFRCHILHTFEPVPAQDLAHLAFGDLVRLRDPLGRDVHAFVYLGPNQNDQAQHIVFTKNGLRRGHYLFQTFDIVAHDVYAGTAPSYYRAVRGAQDPSEDARSPCVTEYLFESGKFGERRQPHALSALENEAR